MANQEYSQAQTMRDEGYSLQQIADELGISKSSVHRLLKDESSTVPTVPETIQEQHEWNVPETFQNNKNQSKTPETSLNQTNMTESQIQLERLKLELEYKCKMEELAIQRLDVENKRKENLLKEAQSLQATPEKSQLFIETKSEKVLKRYHKLVNSFHEQQESENWDVDDCKKFITKVEELEKEVEQFALKSLDLDHKDLVIWNNLDFLLDLVSEALEAHKRAYFRGSCVSIDTDEDEQEWVDMLSNLSSIDEIVEEDEEDED